MNKLNFIKADKPDCSNATDSGKITVTVREFITTTLAEKIATALWNKPEWADSIIRFNYDNKIKNDCFNVIAQNETGDVVGGIRIPCNSHNRGILHSGGCALQQRHKQAEAQQQTAVPFQSGCNSVHMPLRKPEFVRIFSVKGKRCTAASVMHLCISNEAAGCHFTGPVTLASQSLRKRLLSFASQAFVCFAQNIILIIALLIFSCLYFSMAKYKKKKRTHNVNSLSK